MDRCIPNQIPTTASLLTWKIRLKVSRSWQATHMILLFSCWFLHFSDCRVILDSDTWPVLFYQLLTWAMLYSFISVSFSTLYVLSMCKHWDVGVRVTGWASVSAFANSLSIVSRCAPDGENTLSWCCHLSSQLYSSAKKKENGTHLHQLPSLRFVPSSQHREKVDVKNNNKMWVVGGCLSQPCNKYKDIFTEETKFIFCCTH